MKKILLGLIIIMLMIGCGKGKEIKSDIVSFKYNYGGYNGGYYEYSIILEDDKAMFSANGSNGVDLYIDKEIDKSYFEKLAKVINDNKIYKWNGFDETDKNILDGYSFELIVKYKDDSTLKAYGYMKYPDEYNIGHEALTNFLESIN